MDIAFYIHLNENQIILGVRKYLGKEISPEPLVGIWTI